MGPENTDTYFVHAVDPFSAPDGFFLSFFRAVLATALFRCWHIILFFTAWATAICLIADKVKNIGIQPTLLTVLGTVLGFVISYRTSSSFERYNEGRRLWASVIFSSRTLSRFIWFHVADTWATGPDHDLGETEQRGRSLVEKKTVINLIEGFAVALKHYLRGEDGIYYEDLYHLVKYLPAYALPRGMALPSPIVSNSSDRDQTSIDLESQLPNSHSPTEARRRGQMLAPPRITLITQGTNGKDSSKWEDVTPRLLPPRNPPKSTVFDVFPFSLIGKILVRRGVEVSGKKNARARARKRVTSHNIPLEITLYISSYISTLQSRKHIDVPTLTNLINALNMMGDSLTGLERVLTTPIPFSYSVHLWSTTCLYCLALPFQLWGALKWITIPATFVASFIFFGFLAAGEEIENPFGYDKNDLNLDHFTHNIIRLELNSLTSRAMPSMRSWAFSPANTHLFGPDFASASPEEWVRRGPEAIASVLTKEAVPMSAMSI